MTTEQLAQAIIDEFKDKTGLNLFEATHDFYDYLLYYIDDIEQLIRYLNEDSASTYDTIMDLADYIIKKKSPNEGKGKLKGRIIQRAMDYSVSRCMPNTIARKDKYIVAAEEMFPEEKIIEGLIGHDMACFNPLMFHSDYKGFVKCVFRPALSLVKRYPFIHKEYYPGTFVTKDVLINLEQLRSFDKIYINEGEIGPIYYNLYHPILWSRIVNKEFEKFILIS